MGNQMVTAQTFPSHGHLKALRQRLRPAGSEGYGSLANLDDEQTWQWHGYVYGMRRAMLGKFEATSPIDPMGEWFHLGLVEAAERFYGTATGRGRSVDEFEPIPAAHLVRPYWRQVSASRLSEAERALAVEFNAGKREAVFDAIGNAKFREMPKEPGDMRRPAAREIHPPPLADENDPLVREQLRRMGDAA